MAAKRVQILEWDDTACRWRFVAHGAPYSPDEADKWEARAKERGKRCKRVPLIREAK